MPFQDIREFIDKVSQVDKLVRIDNADWDLEIGGLTEITARSPDPPALLFDRVRGYQPGFRVFSNMVNSTKRAALALDMPLDAKPLDLVRLWKERVKGIKPVPPKKVKTGPVLENVVTGKDIDLFRFPVPRWHELDGGRYIGTGCMVIQRDLLDDKWVNVAVYRMQIHEPNCLGIHITRGHHGHLIAEKYWAQGKPCPIALTFGQEPALWIASTHAIPDHMPEYDYAGGVRGEPVEVFYGEYTGLPIPATAEIAVEGDLLPLEKGRMEGPFGEWEGYYGSGARIDLVIEAKTLMYRNNPILTGAPPFKPNVESPTVALNFAAATIWSYLESAGVPDVKGVYRFVSGQMGGYVTIISIAQKYAGHSRQAAHAAIGCRGGAQEGRFVIVVDDDIDPSDIYDVLWAISTRCDPSTQVDILKGCWSSYLDPRIEPAEKKKGNLTNSRMIIDACRPFHWMKEFPPVNAISPELKAKLLKKWGEPASWGSKK